MMVDAPAAVAAPLDSFTAKVSAFVAAARSAATDGLTWAEFGQLLVSLLRLCVTTLDAVTGMSGAEKKAAVLAAAASLFDAVADKAVPSAAFPLWVLVRPAVRSLVLAIAAGAMEQVLTITRGR